MQKTFQNEPRKNFKYVVKYVHIKRFPSHTCLVKSFHDLLHISCHSCTKLVINGSCSNISKTLSHIIYHTNISMKVMCNTKCQLLKAVRDHNTINEEDLKHVGNIKDLLSMRVF